MGILCGDCGIPWALGANGPGLEITQSCDMFFPAGVQAVWTKQLQALDSVSLSKFDWMVSSIFSGLGIHYGKNINRYAMEQQETAQETSQDRHSTVPGTRPSTILLGASEKNNSERKTSRISGFKSATKNIRSALRVSYRFLRGL